MLTEIKKNMYSPTEEMPEDIKIRFCALCRSNNWLKMHKEPMRRGGFDKYESHLVKQIAIWYINSKKSTIKGDSRKETLLKVSHEEIGTQSSRNQFLQENILEREL